MYQLLPFEHLRSRLADPICRARRKRHPKVHMKLYIYHHSKARAWRDQLESGIRAISPNAVVFGAGAAALSLGGALNRECPLTLSLSPQSRQGEIAI